MDRDAFLVELGRIITERRKELGFTQDSLADAVSLHRTYINEVEQGKRNVSINSLRRIAFALRCPASTLLGVAEFSNPQEIVVPEDSASRL